MDCRGTQGLWTLAPCSRDIQSLCKFTVVIKLFRSWGVSEHKPVSIKFSDLLSDQRTQCATYISKRIDVYLICSKPSSFSTLFVIFIISSILFISKTQRALCHVIICYVSVTGTFREKFSLAAWGGMVGPKSKWYIPVFLSTLYWAVFFQSVWHRVSLQRGWQGMHG